MKVVLNIVPEDMKDKTHIGEPMSVEDAAVLMSGGRSRGSRMANAKYRR